MNRIVILGATGSGKTTLAFRLAAELGYPATDLDDLYWRPGWIEAPQDEFRRNVDKATTGDKWVLAGNYEAQKDISWPRADTLIWLDYSLSRTFGQLARRTFQRLFDPTPICNGNRESFGKLFTKDNIILWLFQTHGKKRREYGAVFENKTQPNIQNYIRLKNPTETESFLKSLNHMFSPAL